MSYKLRRARQKGPDHELEFWRSLEKFDRQNLEKLRENRDWEHPAILERHAQCVKEIKRLEKELAAL